MTCGTLSFTGLNEHLGLVVLIAVACLVVGVTILLVARHRRAGVAVGALLLVLVIGTVVIAPTMPAEAASSDCVQADNSLTVTQTSTMQGLAPGIDPVPITGRVVNNGTDSTRITAVEVEITSVTTGLGSTPGTCDASDYLLRDVRMSVERTLGPGGSTEFSGASIGFGNKATNQDACQNATIHLLYTANPG